jgi:hypothetical protein
MKDELKGEGKVFWPNPCRLCTYICINIITDISLVFNPKFANNSLNAGKLFQAQGFAVWPFSPGKEIVWGP